MVRDVHVNQRGTAMVVALCVLLMLSVLALNVMALAVGEKITTLTDYSGSRSFYSADAATEGGLNWIRQQSVPPPILDSLNDVLASNAYTTLSASHQYKYNVLYVNKRVRPGWSVEYKDYAYTVQGNGASALSAQSAIQLDATKLYREGY